MKPYPNAHNYDSDYDYYLDCINYSEGSVKAHFDETITQKIQDFASEIEGLLGVYHYTEDGDVMSQKIADLLYEAYETAKDCQPTKLTELI